MKEKLRILLDNLYGIATGKLRSDRTDWNTLCNAALFFVDRNTFTSSLEGVPRLKPKQTLAVRRFYAPWIRFCTDRYHRIYTHQSQGKFDPRYIPEDLFFMHIDRYFCDREESRFLDNKCYYPWLFPDVKQPGTVCMRVGGSWRDGEGKLISFKEAVHLAGLERALVVKKAVNSECGKGVYFLGDCSAGERQEGSRSKAAEEPDGRAAAAGSVPRRKTGKSEDTRERFRILMRRVEGDVIVQRPIRQHPDLAALHPESVNSMRIISMLEGDKVKVLGAILKIGVGGARMDNSSSGGIICGVYRGGRLSDYGLYHDGRMCRIHPQLRYRFSRRRVPCLDKAFELVRKAHAHLGHYRIVGWDVTIDDEGEAVLIETNLCLGSINAFQVFHGPLFGKDTEKVMNEVFGGRRKMWTTLY